MVERSFMMLKMPVLRNSCTKAVVCTVYSVCGMVYVKHPLLLNGKSSPSSGGNGFPVAVSV